MENNLETKSELKPSLKTKVLLVEDQESDYLLFKKLLNDTPGSQFDLDWATDFDSAMKAIHLNEHHICFIDHRLGPRSGLDLLRDVVRKGCKTPMILLTGRGDRSVDIGAQQAGAFDYLEKGRVDATLLERVIRYAIERKNIQRDVELQGMVLRNITEGVCLTRISDGVVVYTNPAFDRMFGLQPGEAVVRHMDGTGCWKPEFSGTTDGEFLAAKHDDGKRFWCRISVSRFEHPQYGPVLVGVHQDINESKLNQEALARSEEERAQLYCREQAAIEASRLKSEFLATMSHEIRTPINAIVGMTDMLLTSRLDEEQGEFARTIKHSTDSLLTVINDILDFSKVEAGKMELEVIDFNLARILGEIRGTLATSARKRKLALRLELPDKVPTQLRGDPSRLRQVLMNLVSNAIKFTREGSVTIRVSEEKDSTAESPWLRFEVNDTGIGIPAGALHRMFTAFSQVDSSTTRKYGGTGLGLSISKKLVELMGGTIGVESEEGKGATFWFRVGFKKATQVVPRNPHRRSKRVIKHTKNARLLVAEDNVVNQRVALKALKKLGYRAQVVGNGNELLDALRELPYDLIIMDCHMPDMDGYEATKIIRSSLTMGIQSIPIIAMTANALKGDREKCLKAGMNDYMSKPLDFFALGEKIEKWLGSRSSTGLRRDKVSVDPQALLKLMDFEDDVSGFLDIFFRTAPERIHKIRVAVRKGDPSALFREAHSLKSSCDYVGAQVMQGLCVDLERTSKGKSLTGADRLVAQLEAEYGVAKEELKLAVAGLSQRERPQ